VSIKEEGGGAKYIRYVFLCFSFIRKYKSNRDYYDGRGYKDLRGDIFGTEESMIDVHMIF